MIQYHTRISYPNVRVSVDEAYLYDTGNSQGLTVKIRKVHAFLASLVSP